MGTPSISRRAFLKTLLTAGAGLGLAGVSSTLAAQPNDNTPPPLYLPLLIKCASATGWRDIRPPLGWPWQLPFTVQQRERRFRPSPGWDIWAYAGISGLSLYVTPSGSDSNTGASWAQAKRTVAAAALTPGASIIYIAAGDYGYGAFGFSAARDQAFIGVGGLARFSPSQELAGWSAIGAASFALITPVAIGAAWDWASLDENGFPHRYTLLLSPAAVDATPGSYYKDELTNVFYIHCLDGRKPDARLKIVRANATALEIAAGDRTYYLENIAVEHGTALNAHFYSVSSSRGVRLFAKNCAFRHCTGPGNAVTLEGLAEGIFQSCTAYNSLKDGFNYSRINGVDIHAIEIDCESHHHGSPGDATMNASTAHNGSTVVRLNGDYHHTYGPLVVDVNGSRSWNLGVAAHNSLAVNGNASSASFYSAGVLWLDSCTSTPALPAGYDLVVEAEGDAIYYRDYISGGQFFNGGGVLLPY